MQFVFVEFWVSLEIILYGINHGLWHLVFGVEAKQGFFVVFFCFVFFFFFV